jgi:hypothetical protein
MNTTPATIPLTPPGLVPANMTEAMRLAEMMANAKLVPKDLQKSPADCLMVIQQAIRWDMDPFAVAQECSVIQGKLMHSGKLVAAVVNARGNLAERLSFAYDGNGDARTVTVSGRLQGEASARTVSVRLGEAKTNNRVWQTQPDQQLAYHGARVWARRHVPELMLGVYSPEEFSPEEFDEPKRTPPKPAPNVILQPLPPHDAETGEVDEPADDAVDSDLVAAHMERCEAAAAKGWKALKLEWDTTPEAVADILRDTHLGRWKEIAKAAEVPA